MSDEMVAFKEMQKVRRAGRLNAKALSTKILRKNGVDFEFKNKGLQLVVDDIQKGKIDFWPSTGTIYVRNTGQKLKGVENLLALINNSALT